MPHSLWSFLKATTKPQWAMALMLGGLLVLPFGLVALLILATEGGCEYDHIIRTPSPDGLWIAENKTAICPLAFGSTVTDVVEVILAADETTRFQVYAADSGLAAPRLEWQSARALTIFDLHREDNHLLGGGKWEGIDITVKRGP